MYGPSPAERNATARRLIARKKLEDALELLNETIRRDPRFAESFENRAEVFDLMGMYPQAQADRHKAAELRAAYPPAPPPAREETTPAATSAPEPSEDVSEDEQPSAEGEEEPPAEDTPPEGESAEGAETERASEGSGEPPSTPPPVVPAYRPPRRPSTLGALMRAAAVVFFAAGFFIAAGVGVYLSLEEIQGSDDGDGGGVAATQTPEATEAATDTADNGTTTAGATDVPVSVEEALAGAPYSFTNLEDAWAGRDLTATVGDISESVTGFATPAVDFTLSKGGVTMEMSVLVYGSSEAKDDEWTLGSSPEPKVEAELPPASSVWYNRNTVVIVRLSHDTLRQDALDGYLEVTG